MKRYIALLLIGSATIFKLEAQCKIDYTNYHEIFRDDFNYPVTQDPLLPPFQDNWHAMDNTSLSFGSEEYAPSQISFHHEFEEGYGNIDFVRLTSIIETPWTKEFPSGSRVIDHLSGGFKSRGLINSNHAAPSWVVDGGIYSFGMFEIRCRFNFHTYNNKKYPGWPAFWLGDVTNANEIDIFDNNSPWPQKKLNINIDDKQLPNTNPYHSHSAIFDLLTRSLLDWNTITCVWTPTKVSFFLNGREIETIDDSRVHLYPYAMDELIINLESSLNGGCSTNFNPLAYFDIDYFRVLEPNTTVTTSSGPAPDYSTPYKSPVEYMNHIVSYNPTTLVSPNYQSIAFDPTNQNIVYYKGDDNRLYIVTRPSAGSPWLSPTPFGSATILGDLVSHPWVGDIVYKGTDNRLQYFGHLHPSNVIYQDYLDNNWGTTANLVSPREGAIAIADDGVIFYIGMDDLIHMMWNDNVGTLHFYTLSYSTGMTAWNSQYGAGFAAYGVGDIKAFTNGTGYKVIYKGWQEKLIEMDVPSHSGTSASWNIIDGGNWADNFKVSNQPGSITVDKNTSDIYYIDKLGEIHKYAALAGPWSGWGYDNMTHTYTSSQKARRGIEFIYNMGIPAYFGNDGRLQCFWKDGSGVWWQTYIDDNWATNEFETYDNTNPYINPSLVYDPANDYIFYTGQFNGIFPANFPTMGPAGCLFPDAAEDEHQWLRYFVMEPCENLNPPIYTAVAGSGHQTAHKDIPGDSNLMDGNADRIKIYPNPATDKINFSIPFSLSDKIEIIVKDINGRVRMSRQILPNAQNTNADYSVNVDDLSTGMYFIEITANERHVVSKFLKL